MSRPSLSRCSRLEHSLVQLRAPQPQVSAFSRISRSFGLKLHIYAWIARLGRRISLLAFCAIFLVGAVSTSQSTRTYQSERGFSFFQALQTALGGNRGLAYMYSGRAISGFAIGGISAIAPTFVSECAPKEVRGRITGILQVMIAVGGMVSYWINRES